MDIYTLIGKNEKIISWGLPFSIINDYIVILSPDGEIKREISMFEALRDKIPVTKLAGIYLHLLKDDPFHLFYTNSIAIAPRDIEGLCNKGDLLICTRHLNLIGILDIKTEKVTWSWGQGIIDKPHYPRFLKNNNILIFDNRWYRNYSRVIELDPFSKEIVWEYKGNPPSQFYTKTIGSNQRLPNGNTLITESNKGHVVEITSDGEIVWEWFNPEIRVDYKERAVVYRMERITDPENYPFLGTLTKSKQTQEEL